MSFRQEIIILSGRSGAGKGTAAKALEDLGYFVVDNLPINLMDDLLAQSKATNGKPKKIALVVDVRAPEFLSLMPEKWQNLDDQVYQKELIYLNASDKKLLDRYHETRRKHPLDDGCGINKALAKEESLLEPLRQIATKEIFTDKLNGHELRAEIARLVGRGLNKPIEITILSFGFKNGVPPELDYCFDVRFLKNPHYDLKLRPKSGLDVDVTAHVLSDEHAQEFLAKTVDLIEFVGKRFEGEGRLGLTCAIGCTGGQHRSVALSEEIANRLKNKFSQIRVEHRDVDGHHR